MSLSSTENDRLRVIVSLPLDGRFDSQLPHVVTGFMVASDDDGRDRSDLLPRVVGVEGAQSSEFGGNGERLEVVGVSESLEKRSRCSRVSVGSVYGERL